MAVEKQAKANKNDFMIYEVVLSEFQDPDKHFKMSVDSALKNANAIYATFFEGRKLNLYTERKSKGEDIIIQYPNDVMAVHEDIFLLRINNRSFKTLIKPADTMTNGVQDYTAVPEESNPYSYVIIDNRSDKGICQIAIQKNSAWSTAPNSKLTLRLLLETNINRYFMDEGIPLQIEIVPKMRKSEIWEFCKQRCNEGQDAITQVAFDFPNQRKLARSNRIPNPKGYVRDLAHLMDITDAIKTHIELDYTCADPDTLQQNASDLAHIVDICSNENYQLSIKFRDYGMYKCGEIVRALFPMKEALLNVFMSDWTENALTKENVELFNWCDYVYEQAKLFEYAEQTPAKRHR